MFTFFSHLIDVICKHFGEWWSFWKRKCHWNLHSLFRDGHNFTVSICFWCAKIKKKFKTRHIFTIAMFYMAPVWATRKAKDSSSKMAWSPFSPESWNDCKLGLILSFQISEIMGLAEDMKYCSVAVPGITNILKIVTRFDQHFIKILNGKLTCNWCF